MNDADAMKVAEAAGFLQCYILLATQHKIYVDPDTIEILKIIYETLTTAEIKQ